MNPESGFSRLPTAAKLLLILTAVMLPIGLALTWLGARGIDQAKVTQQASANDQARIAAKAIESLFARNALALRIAANGTLANGSASACERTQRALSIAPAVAEHFELDSVDGSSLCAVGAPIDQRFLPLVAPGAIKVAVSPDGHSVAIRMGVIGGMATDHIPLADIREAAMESGAEFATLSIRDTNRHAMQIVGDPASDPKLNHSEWPIGSGQLIARIGTTPPQVAGYDRLILLLPVMMWVLAALISWGIVNRLLIQPLRRLDRAVVDFQPGQGDFIVSQKLGPAAEIEQLRDSFARAVERIEKSESEMGEALEGQRKLVREVHHRVKNNLQVVASLLNIHGRSAESREARDAYVAIGRRVGALSVVHRNHFAEMEENRGIALRPLISELAAELRASAPDAARGLAIDLDVNALNTTQDVAVAVAFLVTEIVEFSMLNCPLDPVEIGLKRTSEITARLTLNSKVLNPDEEGNSEKVQFERIVAGLAKQLRSTLERHLGRYSVEIPIFPSRK